MSEEDAVKTFGASDIDPNVPEDDERLKGDAIGDTLYSESWVLKTLVSLTQELPKYSIKPDSQENEAVELKESLENDLCLLWDMTADTDVANCLFKHDILSITKCVIEESIAPRLTEIAIGILANISCQPEIGSQILLDQDLIKILVHSLMCDDTQTIIQVVRLLDTLVRSSKTESCTSLTTLLNAEALWKSIAFILQNSMNEELLCGSCKLLDILTSRIDPENKFPCESLLLGIIECQNQVKNSSCTSPDELEYSETILDAFDALISALYNLSRIEEMRTEMVNRAEEVSKFIEFYLSYLVRKIRESSGKEEVMTTLTTSAVQAVTIYYVAIDSTRSQRIFELSGYIGAELKRFDSQSQASEYVCDYSEMVGDCFRKRLDIFGDDHCLGFFEPLNAGALSFVLRAAHQTVPNRLQELIRTARTKGSLNKLIETYESCASSGIR